VLLFAPIRVPVSVLPSRRTRVSLQAGIAIASVKKEATNTDLVFIVGVLSGFIVLGYAMKV